MALSLVPPTGGPPKKKVKDISLPTGSMLILILRRDEEPRLITPATEIQTGDQIIALTPTVNEDLLKSALKGR